MLLPCSFVADRQATCRSVSRACTVPPALQQWSAPSGELLRMPLNAQTSCSKLMSTCCRSLPGVSAAQVALLNETAEVRC